MAASTHVGMAASSVLEPMVQLFRLTGEQRYLDFCWYIIDAAPAVWRIWLLPFPARS